MTRPDRSTADSFLEGVCLYRELVFIVFVISVVMWLLSFVSFLVVDPGSATYVITVLNLFGLGLFGLTSGAVLYICRERRL